MTTSPGTVVRLSAVILLGVVLQLAVISQISLWGANVDLTPLIVVCVGLLAGSVTGSVTGFCVGLLVDMALVQTLGVTSLLLTGVGYLSGRYREVRDSGNALVPPIAGALATFVYAAAFSVTQFLLGVESAVSGLFVRDIVVQALVAGLVAMPVFAVLRSFLRPSLTEPYRPRRRSPASGLRIPAG